MDPSNSNYLRQKWIDAFHFIDVNGDGEHTVEDFIAVADFINKKTGANPEEASKTRQEFTKWFDHLQPDPTVKVDLARYLQTCEELYVDAKLWQELLEDWAREVFQRFDLNHDGKIDPSEFAVFYEAHGITDMDFISASFSKIDKNRDGFIELEEFVDVFIHFNTDDDPSTGAEYLLHKPNKIGRRSPSEN